MNFGTVTVDQVAAAVLTPAVDAGLWDVFMGEYVPQTPEFAFVREMNPGLVKELFQSAFTRWRIRRYWAQFGGKVTVSAGVLDRFVLDQVWVDANCQLPDLQEWARQLVTT